MLDNFFSQFNGPGGIINPTRKCLPGRAEKGGKNGETVFEKDAFLFSNLSIARSNVYNSAKTRDCGISWGRATWLW
jgi:hypothetical protein